MKAVCAAVAALIAPIAAYVVHEPDLSEPATGVSNVLSDLLIRDASKEGELRSEHEREVTLSNEAAELRERLRGKEKSEKKLRTEAKISEWAWTAIRAKVKREQEKERRICSNRTASLKREAHVCETQRKQCHRKHESLNQELAALRQDLEWERARRVDAETHVQSLAKRLSTMAGDMAAKPDAAAAEESEMQALKKELSVVSADLATKSIALHAAQAALQAARQNFETEMPAMEAAQTAEAKELRVERSWRLSATKELAETHKRLVESGTMIQEVRAEVLSKDKQLNATREELKTARAAKVEVGKELSASREKMASLMMEVFDLKKAMESQSRNVQALRTELVVERSGEQELNKTRNILAAKDRELSLANKKEDEELQQARKEIRTKDLELNAMQMKVTADTQDVQAARTQAATESKEVKALRIELAIAKAGAKAAHAEQNILGILTKELNESRVAFTRKLKELDTTRKELEHAKETCVEHRGFKDMNATHDGVSVAIKAQAKAEHSEEHILDILTKELNESRLAFAAKIQELDYTRKQLADTNACCDELRSKDRNATHREVSVNETKAELQSKETQKKLVVKDQELEAARLLIKTLEDNSKLEKKL